MILDPPFSAVGEHIGVALHGARALFTTRRGGVSEGPYATLNLSMARGDGEPADDPRRVAINRDRLAGQIGVSRGTLIGCTRQVHGTTVAPLYEVPAGADGVDRRVARLEADAQATPVLALATAVLVADCLPVAVLAPEAVAMVHAGWRGLADGVIESAVATLRDLGAAGQIAAAIGPGIGSCCYDVGEEVHARFALPGAPVREGRRLDLKLAARGRLEAAGVGEVHDVGLCTSCSDPGLFFSHRRDRGVTGRQAGLAWREAAGRP